MRTYLVYYTVDDERVIKLMNEYELIKLVDESDFTGVYLEQIYDVGDPKNLKPIHYTGWQPGCLIQFTDDNGNVVVSGYGTNH